MNNNQRLFYEEAKGFLERELIGKTFPKDTIQMVGELKLKSQLRPAEFAEDIVVTLLQERFAGSLVTREPFGDSTFPDVEVQFSKTNKLYFEVKSKSNQTVTTLMNLTNLITYANKGFDFTNIIWIIVYFTEFKKTLRIDNVKIGPLWALVGQTASQKLKVKKAGVGRNTFIYDYEAKYDSQEGYSNPQQFFEAVNSALKNLNYSSKERTEFTGNWEKSLRLHSSARKKSA
jgi:hypothetical protein